MLPPRTARANLTVAPFSSLSVHSPRPCRDDPARKILAGSATPHIRTALGHIDSENYAGEHWLGSFAVSLFFTRSPD
jgi:hypothetical protein